MSDSEVVLYSPEKAWDVLTERIQKRADEDPDYAAKLPQFTQEYEFDEATPQSRRAAAILLSVIEVEDDKLVSYAPGRVFLGVVRTISPSEKAKYESVIKLQKDSPTPPETRISSGELDDCVDYLTSEVKTTKTSCSCGRC